MWIKRDILEKIQSSSDAIQVFRGPRQCGKTSLVLKLDPEFKEISLDDPHWRELAQNDPELFLRSFKHSKLFIDEAQYAPQLFPSLKRRVDLLKRDETWKPHTVLRLTGSNQILMDKNVKESLAGRASFFDLNTLSVSEILQARKISIQDILYLGGWPELHATEALDSKKFLDDYINSYIEKDIVLAAGVQKSREFLKFTKLLAGRVGEVLDLSSLGKDAGVDAKTVKDWISILERMHIISLVPPYFSNLSSRLIKSPKVYFIDTGLACRLQGWTSAETILTSPQQGHLFENLVFSEIFKMNQNYQLGLDIYHWRSKDGEEVDFLIRFNINKFLFLEVKVSPQNAKSMEKNNEVKKVFKDNPPPLVVCFQEGDSGYPAQIPIANLKEYLLRFSSL
ncbi:MAG: ATP-binding protein [Pseudobdellovibrionaceae bacterium]